MTKLQQSNDEGTEPKALCVPSVRPPKIRTVLELALVHHPADRWPSSSPMLSRAIARQCSLLAWADPYGGSLARAWDDCPRVDWLIVLAARLGGQWTPAVLEGSYRIMHGLCGRHLGQQEADRLSRIVLMALVCSGRVPGADPADLRAFDELRKENLRRLAEVLRAQLPRPPRLPIAVPPPVDESMMRVHREDPDTRRDQRRARREHLAELAAFRRHHVIDLAQWRRYVLSRRGEVTPVQDDDEGGKQSRVHIERGPFASEG